MMPSFDINALRRASYRNFAKEIVASLSRTIPNFIPDAFETNAPVDDTYRIAVVFPPTDSKYFAVHRVPEAQKTIRKLFLKNPGLKEKIHIDYIMTHSEDYRTRRESYDAMKKVITLVEKTHNFVIYWTVDYRKLYPQEKASITI